MRKSEAGEMVNITEEALKLANNIITQMMVSLSGSETEGEAEKARTIVREVTQILGEFNVSDVIWFCKNFDLQGIKKRGKDISEWIDTLLERKGHKGLILDFFTAATDTTAISLEWALAELINNPRVLKKAQEEINKVVGNDRLAQESDIPHLRYIQAILKETFRLHPPLPLVSRKSEEDCTIGGYHIQANTLLFVNVWSIGNPKYWENPLEFWPERFSEDGKLDVMGQNFELQPFGTGRRGCPGIPLAMQVFHTVLALLIQCFEYEVPNLNGVNVDERPGLTAPRATDLMCVLKPRIDLSGWSHM